MSKPALLGYPYFFIDDSVYKLTAKQIDYINRNFSVDAFNDRAKRNKLLDWISQNAKYLGNIQGSHY